MAERLWADLLDEIRRGDSAVIAELARQLVTLDAPADGVPTSTEGGGTGAGPTGGPPPHDPSGPTPSDPGANPGPNGGDDGRSGDDGGFVDEHGDCYGERARAGVAGFKDSVRTRRVDVHDHYRQETVRAGDKLIVRRWGDSGVNTIIEVVFDDTGVVLRATRVDMHVHPTEDSENIIGDVLYEADEPGSAHGTATTHLYGRDLQERESRVLRRTSDEILRRIFFESTYYEPGGADEAQPTEPSEAPEHEQDEAPEPDDDDSSGSGTEQPDPDAGVTGDCDGLDTRRGHDGDEPDGPVDIGGTPGSMPVDDGTVAPGQDDRLTLTVEDTTWIIHTIDPVGNPVTGL
ncbi:MAG: hypothetical protein AAF467_14745 [Actinomycetota bacterium]